MNRRSLLKALPAAVVAGAAPALSGEVLPPLGSPIAALHREITSIQRCIDGGHGLTDAQANELCDRMMELADEIATIPARDVRDMLLKIMGQTVNGSHDVGDGPHAEEIWAEARALIG